VQTQEEEAQDRRHRQEVQEAQEEAPLGESLG
jgi:hypothetical protein